MTKYRNIFRDASGGRAVPPAVPRELPLRAILRVTKALADPQRIRILLMLGSGELCVCQIVEILRLAPSTVSRHLSVLAGADLVLARKDGRWAYYRLPDNARGGVAAPVLEWLSSTLCADEQILRDKEQLAEVVTCDRETLCRRQRADDNKP